jgi:hypothetical protein
MCKQFVNAIDYTLKNWQPVKQFGLFSEKDYVGNQMINGLGFRIPTIDKDKILRKIESINI